MKIHESYSKKDLVKVINKYNIPNIDLKLTRYEIVKLLCNTETWNEYNLDFLEQENKNKALSIKDKNEAKEELRIVDYRKAPEQESLL